MEKLKGVTLESVVIATRAAKYVRSLADRREVSLSDFPLLIHIDNIINSGATVDIPWKAFESEKM
jgi:glycerol-3-phosphate dehydrogenase (NAD(P)+)